jgi:acetyl esterase/lipase
MSLSAQDDSFSITLDPTSHGSIIVEPPVPEDGKYPSGTVVKVKATGDEGYAVDSIYYSVPGRWGAMYHESLTSTFEITIDQDKHVGASFIKAKAVDHVSVMHNVVYAQPGKKPLKYDVYSPKNASDLPIIVIIHGGAWATNDEDVMRGLARELTKGGKFVACSIDYRWIGDLDGDQPPTSMANIIEDVFGAIAHIMEHAQDYGGDPTRVGVTGDSAGGHLSAAASLMIERIGTKGFGDADGVYEFKPTYIPSGKSVEDVRTDMLSSIKAAAPSYGVFAADRLKDFMKEMPDAAAEATAPLSQIPEASSRSVPQYLTRGTLDGLITDDKVSAFAKALKAKGQTVVYDQVEGAGHAFFDWKPNDQVKETFKKFGVPFAGKMRSFFQQHLYD